MKIEEIVDLETFQKLLVDEMKLLIDSRIGGIFKRSPYDIFISLDSWLGNASQLKSKSLIIISHFKEILQKKSNLPSAQRQYIKALCDLVLRKWVQKYSIEDGQE